MNICGKIRHYAKPQTVGGQLKEPKSNQQRLEI
jgi:hypothetical protein